MVFRPPLSNGRQRVGAFKKRACRKMPLNICIQWNAGSTCVSECVLKTLACRGLRVGPSKTQIHQESVADSDLKVQISAPLSWPNAP